MINVPGKYSVKIVAAEVTKAFQPAAAVAP
jgi:hypothetical protein